ncbi:MAG: hypothetical protein IIA67_12735 [Planctomycetes bacterium]|nr:hypothetical protein [Planctomycetota bacterium]
MTRYDKLRHPLICFTLFVLAAPGSMAAPHPVPEDARWLVYRGEHGPGEGKHIVLISADQEYRSEQSLPMLAKILAKHHGFHCTVLFGVNARGQVDPTMPVYPKKGREAAFKTHNIPGLEHLAKADLVIFFTRLLTLPPEQTRRIVGYIDSGKPIIGLRTANHGQRKRLPKHGPAAARHQCVVLVPGHGRANLRHAKR